VIELIIINHFYVSITYIISNIYIKKVFILKKIAPLIILALFATGVYLMMLGMNNAVNMAKPAKVKNTQEILTK
jgi:hypothetical protein